MRVRFRWPFIFLVVLLGWGNEALAQTTPPDTQSPAYRESALRRMEIVALVSLPFTSIHSYLLVRSVRMIQSGSVATGLSEGDWTYVGVFAAAMSVSIALYDWNRLRGKDRNEPLLPETPPSTETARRGLSSPWVTVRLRF